MLQQELVIRGGQKVRTDFFWPAEGLVGEFDGEGKYLRANFGGGRSIEDRVLDERYREDGIRALGYRLVRWNWAQANNPVALLGILRDANLRSDRRR